MPTDPETRLLARVYVGVGSNVDRRGNIERGIATLRREFGELTLSTIYQTPAVGFDGDDFYNLVIGFDTGLDPYRVAEALHRIEFAFGRKQDVPRYSPRTLDLDLLIYGDRVIDDERLHIPRDDIEQYDFVIAPLAEIAPRQRHPITGLSFAEMWARFDRTRVCLRAVPDPSLRDA